MKYCHDCTCQDFCEFKVGECLKHFGQDRKLSVLEVVDAFPDESQHHLPIEIRKCKQEIRSIKAWARKHMDQIMLAPDFSRHLWAEALEVITPDEPYERLARLLMMLRLAPKLDKTGNNRAVKDREAYIDRLKRVERARTRPISGLYPFEKVKRGAYRWVACCPIHGEKTPSFTIYLDSNTWHCFGCGESGDSIAFIMKLKGCDFNEALEVLG